MPNDCPVVDCPRLPEQPHKMPGCRVVALFWLRPNRIELFVNDVIVLCVCVCVCVRGCAVACFYCIDCLCYIYLFAVVRHSFDCCTGVVLSKLIMLCGVVL